ncbi:MAG: rSAM-modified peptide [Crocinitomix sp.]|nr:rSAM-modified peptide [Crocinitomix sp.]
MKKLNLKKQEVTALSSDEMSNVKGGRGGWSNFRTGSCGYSSDNPVEECVLTQDQAGDWHENSVTVGCVKS